jgi:hypothetical protein
LKNSFFAPNASLIRQLRTDVQGGTDRLGRPRLTTRPALRSTAESSAGPRRSSASPATPTFRASSRSPARPVSSSPVEAAATASPATASPRVDSCSTSRTCGRWMLTSKGAPSGPGQVSPPVSSPTTPGLTASLSGSETTGSVWIGGITLRGTSATSSGGSASRPAGGRHLARERRDSPGELRERTGPSGQSAAAAATSVSSPGSGSGCTSSRRS